MAHMHKRDGHLIRTGPTSVGHLVNRCGLECAPLPSFVAVHVSGLIGDMVDGNESTGLWQAALGGGFSIGIPSFNVNRTCGAEPLIVCRGGINITYSTNGTSIVQIVWGENPPSTPDRLAVESWTYTFNPGLFCPSNQGSLVEPELVTRYSQLIQSPYECLNYISGAAIDLVLIP